MEPQKSNGSGWWPVLLFVGGVCLFMYFAPSHDKSTPNPVDNTLSPATTSPGYLPRPHTFNDYDCTGNCSGHQAGYDWAEEHSISDVEDCDAAGEHSNSPSFAEGCRAYVEGDDDHDSDKDADTAQDDDPQ